MATSLLTSPKTAHRNLIRILTQSLKRPVPQENHGKHICRSITGIHNVKVLSSLPKYQIRDSECYRRNIFAQIRHTTNRATPAVCDDIREVATPAFADSISEGDVAFQKEVGDVVAEDDVVCEIETEKTAIPVMAPAGGEIIEFLVEDGATVTPGTIIFKLKVGAAVKPAAPKEEAAAPPPPAAAPEPAAPVHAVPTPAAAAGEIPTTPPPVPPLPTGPMSSKPAASVKVTPAAPAGAAPAAAGSREVKRTKMNPMRRRIAQRLKDAQNECAMLTTFNEIDMGNIMQLRTQYKDAFTKKHGLKLGFMSAFVRASAYALTDMPVVNAVIDEAEIVYRDYVDISVAVATPKGLVVPVLRDVEGMNYVDIERALNELAEKARSGALAIEDMDGGTFTISNGGVYGSMFGTPIINPPQSAILGMHGIFDRPVAISGKVEVRPMMYVALTYDHRLIDGREAVTFLKKIKSAVEDPRVMLLDL